MRHVLLVLMVAMTMTTVLPPLSARQQPEKPVDDNSARITMPGCLKGRTLVAINPLSPEPVSTRVAAGRVFRLSGPKAVMNELKKHNKSAVEVTGLVRKSALSQPQGVSVAGGRVRIGGAPMNQDPTRVDPRRDPLNNVDVFDVESFRPINERCPN